MASQDSSKQTPQLCANRCGFFANWCSNCYKEYKLTEQLEKAPNLLVSAPTTVVKRATNDVKASASSHATPSGTLQTFVAKCCVKCNKKTGIVSFARGCENTNCSSHRQAYQHECTFDYKAMAPTALANKLPVIKPDRLAKF